jgi:hypothetical protein
MTKQFLKTHRSSTLHSCNFSFLKRTIISDSWWVGLGFWCRLKNAFLLIAFNGALLDGLTRSRRATDRKSSQHGYGAKWVWSIVSLPASGEEMAREICPCTVSYHDCGLYLVCVLSFKLTYAPRRCLTSPFPLVSGLEVQSDARWRGTMLARRANAHYAAGEGLQWLTLRGNTLPLTPLRPTSP